jgi:signal transduction histidine kinase
MLINPAAREMFGFDPAAHNGHNFATICQKGAFCGLQKDIQQLRQEGGQALVSIAAAGKYLKANLSTVQGGDGTVACVVMSFRDVTVEEAIDRMKTEFIATVSHELKTPLTSMKGSLQYILGKGKWLTSAERELLEICQRNTDRLIRLITSILDISTIESGGVQFVMTPQVPSELVISAVEELRGLALSRNVTVINTVEADLPLITGDHDRLIQVLSNLLANAIKFSEAGKVVKVQARAINRQLAISIADNNRTIPEAERGKLFKKFQQIDQGEGGSLGGSGLGLAISKEIVERHGGQIEHLPIYSGGNEFIITIPLFEEQV